MNFIKVFKILIPKTQRGFMFTFWVTVILQFTQTGVPQDEIKKKM
jgi:hypothetical protein